MKIAVYCASKDGNNENYAHAAEELGAYIGAHHHQLVYGASDVGLMGVLARSVHRHGGSIYGVGLEMFSNRIGNYGEIDELYVAKTFPERRTKMLELGDAFIALPGGIGTLDEISEALCLSTFYFPQKPIIFWNTDGYYDSIKAFIERASKDGFLYRDADKRVRFLASIEELDLVLKT